MSFKTTRQTKGTSDFSHNRCTFSRGLRAPNPPATCHKASKVCVVNCETQCVKHLFLWWCYVFETIEDFLETSSL